MAFGGPKLEDLKQGQRQESQDSGAIDEGPKVESKQAKIAFESRCLTLLPTT